MLLELRFDHSALKDEAKSRGYEEQGFTELMVCQVPGYQVSGAYAKEPCLPGLCPFGSGRLVL